MLNISLFCFSFLEYLQLEDKTSTKIDDKPEKSLQNIHSPMKTNEFTMIQPLDTVTDLQTSYSDEHYASIVSHQAEEIKVNNASKIPSTYVHSYSYIQHSS